MKIPRCPLCFTIGLALIPACKSTDKPAADKPAATQPAVPSAAAKPVAAAPAAPAADPVAVPAPAAAPNEDHEDEPVGGPLGDCQVVVYKVASCARDEGFRSALFPASMYASYRKEGIRELEANVPTWATSAGSLAQCEEWASPPYDQNHLSDPTMVAKLGQATSESCAVFGAAFDEAGGIPRPMDD
jgi:hypothetical protein